MRRKGGISMYMVAITGLLIIGVIYIFHISPFAEKKVDIGISADLFIDMNDQSSKLVSVLKSTTGDLSYSDVFACNITGSSECGKTSAEIESAVKEMDTKVLIYTEQGLTYSYGERDIGDILRAEIPLPNGRTGTIGIVLGISSGQVSPNSGWIWPTGVPLPEGYAVQHCYGEERTKPRPYLHSGIDIGGSRGDPIYAVSDGIVKYACNADDRELTAEEKENNVKGNCHGYGNNVVIKHGNYYVRYSHLTKVSESVLKSKSVKQGEVIGYMGNTGRSFGPHLDFKVYTFDPGQWGYNANIDPLCFYSADYLENTVRLRYREGDPDCQASKNRICSVTGTGSYPTDPGEDE